MGVVAAEIRRQGYSQSDGRMGPSYDIARCASCSRVHQYGMQRVGLWLICSGALSVRFHGSALHNIHEPDLGMISQGAESTRLGYAALGKGITIGLSA